MLADGLLVLIRLWHFGEEVFDEIVGSHGGQVPLELVHQKQFHLQQLLGPDRVVSVDAQLLGSQGNGLLHLRGHEHAGGPQQLQAALLQGLQGQEAVQVVHGQREDLLFALLLLTDLQHPGGHDFPHGWHNLLLHALEVRYGGRTGLLRLEHGSQHPVVEEIGVRVRAADGLHFAAQELVFHGAAVWGGLWSRLGSGGGC